MFLLPYLLFISIDCTDSGRIALEINCENDYDNHKAILHCKKNKYILESDTLFYKEKHRLSNAKKRELKELSKAERKRLQRQMEVKEKSWLINKVNIIRLLDVYSEDEIAKGLDLAAEGIDRSFGSLSYFLPYIRKVGKTSEQYNESEG